MCVLALAAFLPSTPGAVHAQTGESAALFAAEVNGESRTIRAATLAVDERVHADLQQLAEGLGAGFVITASRVQVDLGGDSAWVYFNDTRVNASTAAFSLSQPVIQRDGRAWLSLHEVPAFFQQAFGITLRRQTADAAEEPAPLVDVDVDLLGPPGADEPAAGEPGLLEPDVDEPAAKEDQPAPDPLQELSPDAIQDLRSARGPERIVIDPAHGGEATGVIGPAGVVEKDVVLAVAKALHARLSGRIGREVVLTREDDRALEAAQRAAPVTNPERTLFISLHCGGAMSSQATGAALFYLPDIADERIRQLGAAERQQALAQRAANATASRRLAQRIEQELTQRADMSSRGIRGVPSRVLLAADSPGVLVELGCLTSPDDEERLGDAGYQEVLAEAIADAILKHYGLDAGGAAR